MKFNEKCFLFIGFFIGSITVMLPWSYFKLQSHLERKKVIEEMFENFHNNRFIHNETLSSFLYDKVKVLCMVTTHPGNHESKAIHIKKTWGKRCNKLIFMTTAEDLQLGTVVLDVPETRDALWGKTKASFKYAYDNLLDEFDWFMKADDDKYANCSLIITGNKKLKF